MVCFGIILLVGVVYSAFHLLTDLSGIHTATITPYVLLGVALLVALGFEFVNGFHDTANAVATVIYMHSLEPHIAVVWSGFWNFAGVLTSSGAVAFAIIFGHPPDQSYLSLVALPQMALPRNPCERRIADPSELGHAYLTRCRHLAHPSRRSRTTSRSKARRISAAHARERIRMGPQGSASGLRMVSGVC